MDQTTSWKTFLVWALCGALWGLSWFGLFTIGPLVLPFAILATLLLLDQGLTPTLRRVLWVAFIVWLVFWGLLLLDVVTGGFLLFLVAFLIFAFMPRSGPAGFGILAGLGFWGVWAAIQAHDPAVGWLGAGLGMIAVAVLLFVRRRNLADKEPPGDAVPTG